MVNPDYITTDDLIKNLYRPMHEQTFEDRDMVLEEVDYTPKHSKRLTDANNSIYLTGEQVGNNNWLTTPNKIAAEAAECGSFRMLDSLSAKVWHKVTITSKTSYFTLKELRDGLAKANAPVEAEVMLEHIYDEAYEIDLDTVPENSQIVIQWSN